MIHSALTKTITLTSVEGTRNNLVLHGVTEELQWSPARVEIGIESYTLELKEYKLWVLICLDLDTRKDGLGVRKFFSRQKVLRSNPIVHSLHIRILEQDAP